MTWLKTSSSRGPAISSSCCCSGAFCAGPGVARPPPLSSPMPSPMLFACTCHAPSKVTLKAARMARRLTFGNTLLIWAKGIVPPLATSSSSTEATTCGSAWSAPVSPPAGLALFCQSCPQELPPWFSCLRLFCQPSSEPPPPCHELLRPPSPEASQELPPRPVEAAGRATLRALLLRLSCQSRAWLRPLPLLLLSCQPPRATLRALSRLPSQPRSFLSSSQPRGFRLSSQPRLCLSSSQPRLRLSSCHPLLRETDQSRRGAATDRLRFRL
mmetsp:Transcript_107168/g.320503  ORF Transcript_107168/g.320503 Transcript_107168/m.320503 type:complete len:270 (-) Transcript_107168:171-980(-)